MKPHIEFYGSKKPRGEAEILALGQVPAQHRVDEAALFGTKWFDYRLWHGVTATYYWAHCYRDALRAYCEVTLDRDLAQTARAFTHEDIFLTRDAISCWVARQALDGVGCRYEWAMRFITRRFIDRGWRVFPRPNQLYGEELIYDIRDAWKEECAISLQIAQNPHFRLIEGQPVTGVRKQYVEWLIGQVKGRGQDAWRPLSRLLKEGVMTPSLVEEAFGAQQLRRAKEVAGI